MLKAAKGGVKVVFLLSSYILLQSLFRKKEHHLHQYFIEQAYCLMDYIHRRRTRGCSRCMCTPTFYSPPRNLYYKMCIGRFFEVKIPRNSPQCTCTIQSTSAPMFIGMGIGSVSADMKKILSAIYRIGAYRYRPI